MGSPYVGEIRIFAGNFAPLGWHFCDGGELSIAENETLYQLIGTTYGGDGIQKFKVPDLRGRVPVHMGTQQSRTFAVGEMSGVETVTLQTAQIPAHTHALMASASVADTADPSQSFLANSSQASVFLGEPPGNQNNLHSWAVSFSGGSQPHENMQPFLCLNFIISLYGVFPSQN